MLKKKIVKGMLGFTTAIMLLGFDPVTPVIESVGIVQEVEASSFKMNTKSVTLVSKEKYQLSISGVSKNKQNKIKWSSSSKNLVITVNPKDGRKAIISANKAGNYKVTAKYGKKSYTCTVCVKSLNKTSLTLNKGKKYTLKLSNTKGKAKWKSSKNSIVAVKAAKNSKSAVITAKKPGSATITATVDGKKLTCKITVKGITTIVTPTSTPAATPKPSAKPTVAPKPTETPKPTEAAEPTETPKPTEIPKPIETPSPIPIATPTPRPTVPATGLWLRNTSLYLDYPGPSILENPNVSAEAYPVIEPSNSDERDLKWESYDTSVATVSEDGVITAVNTGTTKVKCYIATNPSIYAECTIEVGAKPVLVDATSIVLAPTNNLILTVNDTYQIRPTVYPSDATYQSVKWETSDSSVATVDDLGNVTAVGEGSAEITCSLVTNPSIKATRSVFVFAKDAESSQEYTFEVLSDFDYTTKFEGGSSVGFDIRTNAPIDKINITVSNNCIQYNTVFVNGEKYGYSFYARKQGNCVVNIYLDGKLKNSWNVTVTSDDANWALYETWLNNVINDIKSSGSNWDGSNEIQKVTMLGQYILDNYDYNVDPNKSFHKDGCGNCNASAFVLKDFAQRYLGLDAQVVNPSYWSRFPGHVVARVTIGDKYYDFDASSTGKAGSRGDVVIKILDK